MRFTFKVEVEVQRNQGKFASREDIAEQLREAIEGADPSSLDVNEAEYETCGWDVTEEDQPKPKRKPRARKAVDRCGTCNAVTGMRDSSGKPACSAHGGTLPRVPAVDPDLDGSRLQAVVDNAAKEAVSSEEA